MDTAEIAKKKQAVRDQLADWTNSRLAEELVFMRRMPHDFYDWAIDMAKAEVDRRKDAEIDRLKAVVAERDGFAKWLEASINEIKVALGLPQTACIAKTVDAVKERQELLAERDATIAVQKRGLAKFTEKAYADGSTIRYLNAELKHLNQEAIRLGQKTIDQEATIAAQAGQIAAFEAFAEAVDEFDASAINAQAVSLKSWLARHRWRNVIRLRDAAMDTPREAEGG